LLHPEVRNRLFWQTAIDFNSKTVTQENGSVIYAMPTLINRWILV